MLGDNDDVTGDDWESLDAEDFPMEDVEPKQNLSIDRQVQPPKQRQLVQQLATQKLSTDRQILSYTEIADASPSVSSRCTDAKIC